MEKEQARSALRACERELRAIGVVSASLFGSVARGDVGPDSDVDVAVRLSEGFSKGGFDYFGRLEDLERRLSVILGCEVDVVEEPARKARLQAAIDKDRALVFEPGSAPSQPMVLCFDRDCATR